MTHGNTLDRVGKCAACGLCAVELTARGVCVDEFACLDAWITRWRA